MKQRWKNLGSKPKVITEFGDFQTPLRLAQSVCALLAQQGLNPRSLVEPTCGYGNLLFSGASQFSTLQRAIGLEVNADHLERAQSSLDSLTPSSDVTLKQADFFETDWQQLFSGLPEPILLLGNPPWVTNAHLGVLGSGNLPTKSNFQEHKGLDAKTGKANFDISEWMIVRLMEAMSGRHGAIAMLCKSAVARKALSHAWKKSLPMERSAIYRIDALTHFDASVDAVLLVTHFKPSAHDLKATIYAELSDTRVETTLGYQDGVLLANIEAYQRWKSLCGTEQMKWRSGIKHDCSKVMELMRDMKRYRNGLDEVLSLEDTYLFPMLKSSDVARGQAHNGIRWMLVPQKAVNEKTDSLRLAAPKTWAYLHSHAELLNKRASSIYRGRPPFSIFGVGDYSFSPWKVAISGFYKKWTFVAIGPFENKPVVLDDTSYFLPFETREQAAFIASLLNSSVAKEFYSAFVFWDAKRPITVELLRRLDLMKLAEELGKKTEWLNHFGQPGDKNGMHATKDVQPDLWASPLLAKESD